MIASAPKLETGIRTLDLELRLAGTANGHSGYRVELWDRSNQSLLAFAPTSCDGIALNTRFVSRLRRTLSPDSPPDFLMQLGRMLAETLLPPPVRTQLFACLLQQQRFQAPALLRLCIEPVSLTPIPWEFVYVEAPTSLTQSTALDTTKRSLQIETGSAAVTEPYADSEACFLARLHGLYLVRSLRHQDTNGNGQPRTTSEIDEKLRVLIVSADPQTPEHPALPHIAAEIRSIEGALRTPTCWNVEIQTVEGATRARFKQAILNWAPHVIYFTGHGEDFDGGILCLHTGEDGADPVVTGRELAEWCAGTPVQMVILSACDTHGIAKTVSNRGIPAVIGMQMPLRPVFAEAFARNLFSLLAQGRPVQEALWWARQHGEPVALPDWGIPILYLQGNGQIFHRPPARTPMHMPRPCNPHFQGRDALLHQIHRCLQTTPLLALTALGGMGKTELALQYARHHVADYPGGIFWVNAQGRDEILGSYALFGRLYLQVPEAELEEQAQWTIRRLQELASPSLLIIDDVQQIADLDGLLPISPLCHLLFTTRHSVALEDIAPTLAVPPLEQVASHALLQTFSAGRPHQNQSSTALSSLMSIRFKDLEQKDSEQKDSEQIAIEQIADEVGHLPLALFLIASYVRQRKSSFAYYARQLKQQKQQKQQLKQGRSGENLPGLEKVQQTLETSFNKLSTLARSILGAASCFATQGISTELLQETCRLVCPRFSSDRYEKALSEVAAYHLISYETPGEDESVPRLNLHECVRYFAQCRLSANRQEKILVAIGELLSQRLDAAHEVGNWRPVQWEIPHCYALIRLYRETGVAAGFREILYGLANYCSGQGDYPQAARLFEEGRMHATNSHVPADTRAASLQRLETARFAMKQAHMEQLQNRPELALTLIRTAIDIAEPLLPATDPAIADYYGCYGLILTRQGQYEQAEKCYHNALSRREAAHGRQHPEIATCLNNLGTLYEKVDRIPEAISVMSEALAIDEALPTPIRPNIAIRLNHLGRFKAAQGAWTEALAFHTRALEIYQQVFVAPHRDIAASLYYTGYTLTSMNRIAEARDHLERALALYRQTVGPDHPNCDRVREVLSTLPLHNDRD